MKYLQDWILVVIQRRCEHPSRMVAVDILEGCGRGATVGYCRRCGAVRVGFDNALTQDWRLPDPHLWRNWSWL